MNDLIDIVRAGFRKVGADDAPVVIVVGDVMLDRYLWGDVVRISPEAPVPVVRIKHETSRLGGAGNVAANLAGLGVKTFLVGIAGDDGDGVLLRQALEQADISADGLCQSTERHTITKTRIIGGHQQMLRLDHEDVEDYAQVDLESIVSRSLELMVSQRPSALLLSDYAKGALTADVCHVLISRARELGIPVLVDPKGRDFEKYRGATGVTPNQQEAVDVCGASPGDLPGLRACLDAMRRDLGFGFIALTRGSEGILLFEAAGQQLFPAEARQVFDVSGAGDTVIATLTAAFAAGLSGDRACSLANVAAGVVVGKVGTVPVQRVELLQALERQNKVDHAHKYLDLETLALQVEVWRKQGLRIVFTNGCFDLLHVGHVSYLAQARQCGDRLIVGLNTDRSVTALKGSTRPVIGEVDRAQVLCALESVSAVVLFDEDTPLSVIKRLQPDVLVKGNDYNESEVVGAAEVRGWGGEVALIPVVSGHSSTQIITKATLAGQ